MKVTRLLLGILVLIKTNIANANWQFNMPQGVTPISKEVYALHMGVFWVCLAIAAIVFGVIIYAIIFHRKSKGAVAANFHDSLIVEIIWTTIPFMILVAMSIPATKVLFKMEDTTKADINIKVTGYMWKWHYQYLDEDFGFMSNISTSIEQINNLAPKSLNYLREVDNPLVVPINKKIRLLTTANDVIHSWWVPELAVKKDAIPGFINETWFKITKPGIYRGQCAELCGANHGYMPIVVVAKTMPEYQKWLTERRINAKAS